MPESPQIVGISLVRNEDLYIERVLLNALDFCDKIIVVDHRSTDNTPDILERLQRQHPKIEVHRVDDASVSHDLIAGFAGSPVWIFGLDGDELYEPARLRALRERVLTGEFDRWWQVFGNVLHCAELDVAAGKAKGYLSPPSRSMTKLFNFGAIVSWEGPSRERLHGSNISFKPGFDAGLRYQYNTERDWDSSDFRCLHLAFVRRSTSDPDDARKMTARPNPGDIFAGGRRANILRTVKRFLGMGRHQSSWKQTRYMQGELVEKNVSQFFPEYDRLKCR
jgi:glycosyltransferase involved in cell wall biosynthesis